jgi:hypothetical protein
LTQRSEYDVPNTAKGDVIMTDDRDKEIVFKMDRVGTVGGPKNGSWKSACRASRLYTEQVFTGVNSKLAWRATRLQSSCTGVHSRTRHRSAMTVTVYYADHRSDGD